MPEKGARFNPWSFVPLLYFMQAVPVTLVQEVATVVYKDLGVDNAAITRWTSLIALPWALQMLLGPLVELNGTKRRWMLGGQASIAAGLILAAFMLGTPNPFAYSLVVLGFTAVASALCNIATDGFYLLSMAKDQQAAFAGVQTTAYRLGRLFCTGILVFIVGASGLNPRVAWPVVLGGAAILYVVGVLLNSRTVPKPALDAPAEGPPGETVRNIARTLWVLALGVGAYFLGNAAVRLTANLAWQTLDGRPDGPLKGWRLPDESDLLGFHLDGARAEWAQLALCAIVVVTAYIGVTRSLRRSEMGEAFGSFIRQRTFPAILAFVLFYRFGEAMVSKMSPLFLKDTLANGGLAIGNEQLGLIKGVAGVLGIVFGGILGGVFVSRWGLKRAIWPMALTMHVPNLLYLWAAYAKPPSGAVYGIEFVDQFGYGFGFAGYMIILQRIAQRGRFRTAHYAIGTGMGALCIAVAGIVSGIVQSNFGYTGFFWAVMAATIPGMLTLFALPLEE
ncbi:hypothetical protein BH11ARM2_BH11ARM2_22950 [soil metagenome]